MFLGGKRAGGSQSMLLHGEGGSVLVSTNEKQQKMKKKILWGKIGERKK